MEVILSKFAPDRLIEVISLSIPFIPSHRVITEFSDHIDFSILLERILRTVD